MGEIVLKEGERADRVDGKITLIQKRDGFSYGTDAVLLAAFLRKQSGKIAIEFGGGTGIISLLAEEYGKFGRIFSVEVQADYFDLMKRNFAANDSSVIPILKDVRSLESTDFGGEADVVFSNPPYMKTDAGKKSTDFGRNTARHEVEGGITDFCRAASKLLKHGGLFYCVYRPDRAMDLLDGMRRSNLEPKRMTMVYSYIDSRPCLMLVEGKKGGASGLFNTKPFVIFNSKTADNSDVSDDMKKVYLECDMDDEYKLL